MRTLTEAEQQEAVAFLCRKFPVIPVTIIKKSHYFFLWAYSTIKKWIKDGMPPDFEVVWPQNEANLTFGDQPEIEYDQVELCHTLKLQLQVRSYFLKVSDAEDGWWKRSRREQVWRQQQTLAIMKKSQWIGIAYQVFIHYKFLFLFIDFFQLQTFSQTWL